MLHSRTFCQLGFVRFVMLPWNSAAGVLLFLYLSPFSIYCIYSVYSRWHARWRTEQQAYVSIVYEKNGLPAPRSIKIVRFTSRC